MVEKASSQSKNIATEKPKIWTRDFVFVCLSNLFIFMGFQMTLPTLPLFVEKLGGSDQLIGFVIGIFTLSALAIRPYAGHALETRGRGMIYALGLIIFVLSVGSYGFIGSIALLFVMRVVQGIGWGMSTTASSTVATDLIPPKRRGEGMGYFGLSGNLALAFGPSLGLFLAGTVTFRTLFLVCGGLGLAAFVLATRIRYKKSEQTEERSVAARFDLLEKTALQPSVLMFFITVTFGGIASFLPLYAAQKYVAGIEFYFFVYALFLLISRLFAGKIYDRRGHLFVFLPGTVLIAAAMLLLSWLPNTAVMLTAAGLYGLGFGSVQPALQAWAVEKAAPNRKGMANATLFSFFDLGVGIGAMVFGQLAGLFGYGSIYIAACGSVVLSMVVYLIFYLRERRAVRL